jgi:hypothetical protein
VPSRPQELPRSCLCTAFSSSTGAALLLIVQLGQVVRRARRAPLTAEARRDRLMGAQSTLALARGWSAGLLRPARCGGAAGRGDRARGGRGRGGRRGPSGCGRRCGDRLEAAARPWPDAPRPRRRAGGRSIAGPRPRDAVCSPKNVTRYGRFGFREIESRVVVQQPAGPVEMLPAAMWRPLRPGATWPPPRRSGCRDRRSESPRRAASGSSRPGARSACCSTRASSDHSREFPDGTNVLGD